MKIVGIICEYNPFHLGHKKQIDRIKDYFDGDCAVVCLMSGNFVQRGAPAIVDKSLRAKAAVLSGADLVLELPVTYALSSAEGFAAGGVEILGKFCDFLCFGCETGDADALMRTAKALLSEEFPPLLRDELLKGVSFPAARTAALEKMGLDAGILRRPNDILAVEYCKAILITGTAMRPMPIVREGSYHAETADGSNPSATAVRQLMLGGMDWNPYISPAASLVFSGEPLHCTEAGERAILGKLRTMTEEEFSTLPYGSEGLWRKFMHACRENATLEEIIAATKSKRYTRSRIDRMVMCAFLGISEDMLLSPAPYTRILAFSDRGRAVLREAKKHAAFINAGQLPEGDYWNLEKRCGDLYGLFCRDGVEAPGAEERQRIFYHDESWI